MRLPYRLAALLGVLFLSPVWALQATGPAPAPATAAAPAPTAANDAAAPVRVPASEAPADGALTRADLSAWLDGFMPYALERGDIAGAVVVVVKDGAILLQKGYGYADVAERKPVDPETTLFRPGSVSKLFTWTAVMQLVEQGKLDLDRDVNEYLDFTIPARDGAPITLRHAMTHTPGLEDTARSLIFSDPAQIVPLGKQLSAWVPTRIFAPGTTPAYSNYATALAGYIVERVSGEPFDAYVDAHILKPLGMAHSTFSQPLPEALQPFMSKGYMLGSDKEPKPYELVGPAPAGSLSSSGADMGRFMIAHLADGAFGDVRILKAETAKQMHETATGAIEPLNRMLLGFYETTQNGRRSIAHGGDTQWFHSYLHLFPQDGIGLYVCVNSVGKEGSAGAVRGELFRRFVERYLPGDPADGKVPPEEATAHAQAIAGTYEMTRRPETGFMSLANLAGQVKVAVDADGMLQVPMLLGPNGQPRRWREIAPYVWRDVNSGERLAAKVENGRVTRFAVDALAPIILFEPAPWWRSSSWLLPAFGAALVALLLTVLAWPISALVRRHYGVGYALDGRDALAHRGMRLAALAVVLTMGAAMGVLVAMLSDLTLLSTINPTVVSSVRLLAMVVLPLAALVALWNVGMVWGSRRRWTAKLWALVLALSCIVVLWVAIVFHVIGLGGANY